MDDGTGRPTIHRRRHWGGEPDLESVDDAPAPLTAAEARADARRILWRDSATILIGIVLALLVVQLLQPSSTGGPSGSASPLPSSVVIGASQDAASLPPVGATLGPIVDPSLDIDAEPTFLPPITLPPTGTQKPDPTPARTPRVTPLPTSTGAPSAPPTVAPSPEPPAPTAPPATDSPPPTQPPPSVAVVCSVTAPLTVTCGATTSSIEPGSQSWSMGGSGTLLAGGNGTDSITWLYVDPGQHTVTFSAIGLDGSSASDTDEVTV